MNELYIGIEVAICRTNARMVKLPKIHVYKNTREGTKRIWPIDIVFDWLALSVELSIGGLWLED